MSRLEFNGRKGLFALLLSATLVMGCSDNSSAVDASVDTGGAADVAVDAGGAADATVDAARDIGGPDVTLDGGGTVMPASWKTILAGTFQMGSPASESCRREDETQHEVTITRAFELQSTEVTQAQFASQSGYNPSYSGSGGGGAECGGNCPVEQVNWHEAAAYCNALSTEGGLARCYDCTGGDASVTCDVKSAYAGSAIYDCAGYRLPTEAEWEYAYRAGTTTAYYGGVNDGDKCPDCSTLDINLDSIAWYCANSGNSLHRVAQKTPNAWGLYDMAGNVWEWTHDGYHDDYPAGAVTDSVGSTSSAYRVARGGSFVTSADGARAAHRNVIVPGYRYGALGFRCARTAE